MAQHIDFQYPHTEIVAAYAAVIATADNGIGRTMDMEGGYGICGLCEGLDGFRSEGPGIPNSNCGIGTPLVWRWIQMSSLVLNRDNACVNETVGSEAGLAWWG